MKNARPYLSRHLTTKRYETNVGTEERKGEGGESLVALRGVRRLRGVQSYERRWNL